ncbi:MAG TPA: sulfur oxidation c-type cytochrome SoxA [Burkholderiales bacterium]|nr:sulfur oxidation c-type cytochrome SoxA [Burkholderiales bacterium]
MKKYFVLAALIACAAEAQNRSGLEFASEEIRRLQASDAENPGMLWVDQGAKLFAQHCASCHASMKGVATRYPAVEKGKIVTLETKIREKMPALAYESDELLALTSYIAHESRGMPLKVNPPPDKLEAGKKAYYQRRGQMNLACAHCHEQNWGKRLGAETLSQGQPNGYPTYRLEWQKMGSLERRIRACMFGLHAALPPYGSEAMLELELFLAWRANGLPIETPAVRR